MRQGRGCAATSRARPARAPGVRVRRVVAPTASATTGACMWHWAPYACYTRQYKAAEAQALVRGRRLLVLGDSTTRFTWFSLQRLLDPKHPALQIQYGYYRSPALEPGGEYSVRDRPGPYTWRSAELNASVTYAMPKYYAERKGRNVLADKTEALVELLRATPYDAVVLGFPLLGDVCNEKAAGELYTMGRERAQPPARVSSPRCSRASYIWRSTPLSNEWHMRDHCPRRRSSSRRTRGRRAATPPRSPATAPRRHPACSSICCGTSSRSGSTCTPT